MMRLGEKIKELRLHNGRTQDAFAGELGVTAQAVSRWEKGICYPDMEMIPSIANYFGVSIDELFGYDNERAAKIAALADKIEMMINQNNGKDLFPSDPRQSLSARDDSCGCPYQNRHQESHTAIHQDDD